MADGRQISIAEKMSSRSALAAQARSSAPPGTDPLPAFAADATRDAVLESLRKGQQLRAIKLDLISPAAEGQARQEFDEERLQTLAESLRRSGVREPIIVTPHGVEPGRFQIVAGERRWRAAKLAGLEEIPCIIDPNLVDHGTKLLAQAEENLHRENLNAVEEARVLAQLMEAREVDVRDAGALIGRSYAQARRLYRIQLIRGELDARGAIEVDRIFNAVAGAAGKDEALKRVEKLLERIVREKWPIRRIEQHAKKIAGGDTEEEMEGGAVAVPAPASEPKQPRRPPQSAAGELQSQPATAAPAPAASTPPPLITRENGRVVIEEARIQRGSVTPEEREQLIAVLEELLMRVRRV
jgi:ParB/RepB/Spo0J family partition protein